MKIDWANISLKDLAGYLSRELQKEGIDLILVGGACVTIYSKNRYQSYDLDFITYEDLGKVKKALSKYGFKYQSKYFARQDCPWIIEFVSPPVAVGGEPIRRFSNVKTEMGTIKMLKPTDCVKDRLASFYHWDDRQGLEQALNVCLEIQEIDFAELENFSKKEGFFEKFQEFLALYHQKQK